MFQIHAGHVVSRLFEFIWRLDDLLKQDLTYMMAFCAHVVTWFVHDTVCILHTMQLCISDTCMVMTTREGCGALSLTCSVLSSLVYAQTYHGPRWVGI